MAEPKDPYEGDSEYMPVSKGEYEDFLKYRISEHVKGELIKWIKSQAWVVLLLFTFLSTIGFTVIVEKLVSNKIEKQISLVLKTAEEAQKATLGAKVETERSAEALEALEAEKTKLLHSFSQANKEVERIRRELLNNEASLKNSQEKLDQASKALQGQIVNIQNALKERDIDVERSENIQTGLQDFDNNTEYFIILLYRSIEHKADVRKIERTIISKGYRCTSYATDLKETAQKPAGTILVLHNDNGRKVLASVTDLLKGLNFPEVEVMEKDLKSGDVQIIFF